MRHIASGKVREIFELDTDHLFVVTTDRISAFDVVMAEPIVDRGRVLTGLTDFWLKTITDGIPHHLVTTEVPDVAGDVDDATGRSMVVRKAEMVPLEFIVRGYLAGSGWAEYRQSGTLHGQPLPEGLQLGSKLPQPVLTPSTKGDVGEHDINLTYPEAADRIGADALKHGEEMALTLYTRASEWAVDRGLILADTKFELGYINGDLSLCDEVLTPDSSRYWPTTGWSLGETPPAYDKQVLRDWLETQEWNKEPPPPTVPVEIVQATRHRYIEAYQRLTGEAFSDWPGVST